MAVVELVGAPDMAAVVDTEVAADTVAADTVVAALAVPADPGRKFHSGILSFPAPPQHLWLFEPPRPCSLDP
jgi:hypothetical protein